MEMVFYCVDCGKFFYGASDKEHTCRHCGSSKTAITQMSEMQYSWMSNENKTSFKQRIRAAYTPEAMQDKPQMYCKKCGKFIGIHAQEELCIHCQRVEEELRARNVRTEMIFYCVDCRKFFYSSSDEETICPHCSSSRAAITQVPKGAYSLMSNEDKTAFKQRIRAEYTTECMQDQAEMCCKKCGKFIGINAELCIDCQRQETVLQAVALREIASNESVDQPPVEIKFGRAIIAALMATLAYALIVYGESWLGIIVGLIIAVVGLALGILSIVHFNETSSVRSGERIPLLIFGIIAVVSNGVVVFSSLLALAAVASTL